MGTIIAAGLERDRNRRLREFEKRARRGEKCVNAKSYGNDDIHGKEARESLEIQVSMGQRKSNHGSAP